MSSDGSNGAGYLPLRGLGWGIVGGAVIGSACYLPFVSGGWLMIVFLPVAAIVGGVIGAPLGLACGVGLALGGSRLTQRPVAARMVAGSISASIPIVVISCCIKGPPTAAVGWLWMLGFCSAAFAAAAVLTPKVLWSKTERTRRRGARAKPVAF